MAEERLGLDLSLFSGTTGSVCRFQSKWSNDSSPRHRSSPICVDLFSERESERFKAEQIQCFRGIDVNRMPTMTELDDGEEEEGVATASSPTSTVSSLTLSGTKRGPDNDLLEEERASFRGGGGGAGAGSGASDEEDTSRKKLRLSKDQSAVLEESFKEHPTLNPKQKMALSKQLNLRPRQVEVWFQNRRARTKLKQTEVDCEFLKRCCENLTEENRRLQRELQELRALKLSPQFYMSIPATTLTICPSCENLAGMAASNNQCQIPAPVIGSIPVRRLDMPGRS